ncbi:MAG: hypothetical protein ABIH69_07310 [bacterium]
MDKKGFSYTVEREKLEEFSKLTYEQRFDWLAKMHRFLRDYMPQDSYKAWQKLRGNEA